MNLSRKNLILITLALMTVSIIGMKYTDSILVNTQAPLGIVSFQFSASLSNASTIINSWGEHGPTAAGFNLGIDYLFLVFYSLLGYLLLAINREKLLTSHPKLSTILWLTAIIFPLSGLFDAIENFGLLKILLGTSNEFWPLLAYYSAIIKFIIVAAGAGAIIASQCLIIFSKDKKE